MGHIHETRLTKRRNLFVAAHLRWENQETSVRIRNISGVGALVESQTLPSADTAARLIRGELSADGHLVWVRGGRAGMMFLAPITPDDWLPSRLKVRQGENKLEIDGDGAGQSRSGPHLKRDILIVEHLVRIRAMVEEVRLEIAKPTGARETIGVAGKLDAIHRLLDWQVAELQP